MTDAAPPTAADLDLAWREGARAMREGRPADAIAHLSRIAAAGRANGVIWLGLAMAHKALGDRPAELSALQQALSQDPRDLRALIMTGDHHFDVPDHRAAAAYYGAALKIVGDGAGLDPALRAEAARAQRQLAICDAAFGQHLEAAMADAGLGRAEGRRVRQSLELLLGRQELYLQQPRHYYFPELPQIAWADRAAFPWLDKVEAATDAIRAELRAVIEAEGAFSPYVQAEANRPVFQDVSGLLDDPSWSAFYLWKGGVPQAENLARCPSVMEALADAPLCRIPGRTPSVLFSLLRPGTHIKPHHGFTNARYICHLPLIVPGDCAMRVGPETRPWAEGEACVFDDSVEHEAWNRHPDRLRVVMIFDIWRPELTGTERDLVSRLLTAVDSYGDGAPAWDS